MSLLIIKPCIFINWPKDSRTTSVFASGFDFLGPKLYFFFLFILVFGALHAKMPLNWWVAGACTIPQSTETIKIVIKMLYAGWWPLVLAFQPPRPFVRSSFRRLSPVDLDSADKSKRLLNVSTMGTTSAAATNWWTKDCAGSKYRPPTDSPPSPFPSPFHEPNPSTLTNFFWRGLRGTDFRNQFYVVQVAGKRSLWLACHGQKTSHQTHMDICA